MTRKSKRKENTAVQQQEKYQKHKDRNNKNSVTLAQQGPIKAKMQNRSLK